ncbi:Alpha-N-acetylneuraminide alpha-2,8-sialyltransferase [Holothuria leucospilota]|uniref:Alpha-N-acetylneuraminide alpha-2,8-sialyltransferase n=1 Tax=Holothuria leucospilota TaxID=206669 RepID=A0A9Q1HK39_HOLLE|nr:Alpha-N-acetylneuraminide alpha-2,8-sialyltransferase [Holothuria leucospilota]
MLTIAETFCKDITLYGFYPYQKDSSGAHILHHYYEPNLKDFHTDAHDFEEEHTLFKSLHKRKFLRLVVERCETKL